MCSSAELHRFGAWRPRPRELSSLWRRSIVLLVHPIAHTGPTVIDRLPPIGGISTGMCGLALDPGRKGLRIQSDSLTIETIFSLFSLRRSSPPALSFITRQGDACSGAHPRLATERTRDPKAIGPYTNVYDSLGFSRLRLPFTEDLQPRFSSLSFTSRCLRMEDC